MRTLTHIVTPEENGRAVRSVVPRVFRLGEHAFRRLKVLEAIFVNGEPARASRILRTGDSARISLGILCYSPVTIETKDGEELTGILVSEATKGTPQFCTEASANASV